MEQMLKKFEGIETPSVKGMDQRISNGTSIFMGLMYEVLSKRSR